MFDHQLYIYIKMVLNSSEVFVANVFKAFYCVFYSERVEAEAVVRALSDLWFCQNKTATERIIS